MGFIYRPTFKRQLVSGDPYGKFNCTAVSAAIAFDRETMGGVDVNGRQVRAASNEPYPDPLSPGLNLIQIIAVGAKWHVNLESRRGIPWASFLAQLKAGRGAILQGDYDQMGEWSSQASFKGDHAIFVNHVSGDGDLFTYDPLARKAREVPASVLKRYGEKFATKVGTSGVICAFTRITPTVAEAQ